ncbi:Uncharacterised protein [Flavonifractor plautii]|uniref:Uncharacterized protein n=1 Tax=Flavonifractor plautii TaxID=292800 RepID=A0A174VU55_FLAPL|nr:Uncharacterised protein [Flavonifractor plautii]
MPTLGKPTRPTSASSLSSRITCRSWPGRPALAKRGTCRVGVAKCLLPQPPFPPLASTKRSVWDMSQIISPVSASRTTVPRGTLMTRSSPSLPEQRLPWPSMPLAATYLRL